MQPDLEAEVRQLLDERAIDRVMQAYCHAMDHGPTNAWVECFTEDGVFDVRDANREPLFRVAGHAELLRFIESYPNNLPTYYKHLYLSPLIDIDGDTASVESYVLVIWCSAGRPAEVSSFGKVSDVWVRGDRGWRIRNRIAITEAMPADTSQQITWSESG